MLAKEKLEDKPYNIYSFVVTLNIEMGMPLSLSLKLSKWPKIHIVSIYVL